MKIVWSALHWFGKWQDEQKPHHNHHHHQVQVFGKYLFFRFFLFFIQLKMHGRFANWPQNVCLPFYDRYTDTPSAIADPTHNSLNHRDSAACAISFVYLQPFICSAAVGVYAVCVSMRVASNEIKKKVGKWSGRKRTERKPISIFILRWHLSAMRRYLWHTRIVWCSVLRQQHTVVITHSRWENGLRYGIKILTVGYCSVKWQTRRQLCTLCALTRWPKPHAAYLLYANEKWN